MDRRSKDFTDEQIRASLRQALLKAELEGIELPATEARALSALNLLVSTGCNRRFLIEASFIYAMLLWAQESNRELERNTRPEYRKLALIGLSWSRADLRRHVKQCRQLADEVERFVGSARVPGGNVKDCVQVLMFDRTLPRVLRNYADLAQKIGRMTDVLHETANKKASCLLSLVEHVRSVTGEVHLTHIADLISGWRSFHPFTLALSDETLRKQYERQMRRQTELALFMSKPTGQK